MHFLRTEEHANKLLTDLERKPNRQSRLPNWARTPPFIVVYDNRESELRATKRSAASSSETSSTDTSERIRRTLGPLQSTSRRAFRPPMLSPTCGPMTSERSRPRRLCTMLTLALIALGCPDRSEVSEAIPPGHIVVDVRAAGDFLVVHCGPTASRIVAEDLTNEIGRCEKLASVPVTHGRIRVKGDTPFSAIFVTARLLDGILRDAGTNVSIEEEGRASVPFRAWGVCYATTPVESCTHLSIEVLRTRLALKTWSGHIGPCASPREKATPYASRATVTAPHEEQTLACHVETAGTTADQLGRIGAHAAHATENVARCSIGTVSVHHDVSWRRAATVVAELQSRTGEVPTLSAIPTEEPGLWGCEDAL